MTPEVFGENIEDKENLSRQEIQDKVNESEDIRKVINLVLDNTENTREISENMEVIKLLPCACLSMDTQRCYPEQEDPYRTSYERDVDRITHSRAFRRLAGKSQVMTLPEDDHTRNRQTHTIEVAQIGKRLAQRNRLNPDLAEAIGLAHDLGHPPLGHMGEKKMREILGCFSHNNQSLQVVRFMEKRSSDYPGLNLTSDTLEGMNKEIFRDKDNGVQPPLEAQCAEVADDISYLAHDSEDALNNGFISFEELRDLKIWEILQNDLQGDFDQSPFAREISRVIINCLMEDASQTFQQNLVGKDFKSSTDAQNAGRRLMRFSPEVQSAYDEAYQFLCKRYYFSDRVTEGLSDSLEKMEKLMMYFLQNPNALPEGFLERGNVGGQSGEEMVRDYVAGMTDEYLLKEFERIFPNG